MKRAGMALGSCRNRPGSRRSYPMRHQSRRRQRGSRRIVTTGVAILAAAAIAAGVILYNKSADPSGPLPVNLPPATASYLGVYVRRCPWLVRRGDSVHERDGAKPDMVMYYSGWFVPFPTRFATTAANNGAVPLVQMDPDSISVAGIASGQYDGYLSAYAEAVRAYRHPVILSFGHEMNGDWYSWGYRHTSPAVFVAAWRHIVTLFRALGARNVTWLWTVNIINDTQGGKIPQPGPVVARQLVCELGRDRRLLPQAVLAVRSLVRADHQCRARADQRPDTHRRDGRGACCRPASKDRRPVRWYSPVWAARVRVVQLHKYHRPGLQHQQLRGYRRVP